ncbi:LysM peptidoglycan-binding domain-containing protein [Sulfurivermis fontis]|uniref:LysM peptidoglycan-binding domain-containing protein n=1 Tax=Sulfurivermis fontis TaxID=1972068 RepID=UPI000FD6EA96|nr:LysM peptidoglycan-binding domain-containing protein [Sulfurivermis fontis]
MEKNPLRISRLLTLLAAAAIVVGCASAPQPAPEPPQPEPVAEPAPLVVKPDAPQQYVVVKGDTLWDISSRFLEDPWRWPELWDSNPQIENPHLIYPGDILILAYKDGRPIIQIHRGGKISTTAPGRPEVRLSPKVRVEGLDRPIPTIPMDAIRPFLSRPRVVTQEELEAAPYIVSSVDRHLVAGPGHRIYVRGLSDANLTEYMVVRPGDVYRNPEDRDDILGYEAIHLGDAQLKDFDDVSTLQINKATREILNGDRLLPMNDALSDTSFLPRAPKDKVRGQIIAVPGGVALIGQFQVVAINLGQNDGMEPGHVLAVYQRGETVRDARRDNELVKMPDEHAGTLMVFRTFARVSYGLVLKATRTMHVNDFVTNP